MTSFDTFIKSVLQRHNNQISEYELLKVIDAEQPDFFSELDSPQRLYQKHFLLFHHLYKLRDKWCRHGKHLSISAVSIELTSESDSGQNIDQHDPLTEFYLDRTNLFLSEDEVQKMQQAFWQKYLAIEKKAESIKILQLTDVNPLHWPVVKKQFQKLAQKHHPDKGGCPKKFADIRQAYNELKQLLK